MRKKIFISLLLTLSSVSYGAQHAPIFDFLPNIKTAQLKTANAALLATHEGQATALVKKTLHISPNSPYTAIRIRFLYDLQNQPQALLVYLLSSQFKSLEITKINLTPQFTANSVIRNYQPTANDLSQSPSYVKKSKYVCPNDQVQFVIGNNFKGDESVESQVLYVFMVATRKGYHPALMDTNNPYSPKPTVEAYKNWMSCPNVKGFYNESHGSILGIMLEDDMLVASEIEDELKGKLKQDVTLFDSCSTFNDPLLSAMINADKANAQQYMAGIVPLPFGPSEKTAACFWQAALNNAVMNKNLVEHCAKKSGLNPSAFRITDKTEKHLRPAL
jgi:hypothetical protein